MDTIDALREAHRYLIDINPRDVLLQREETIPDGLGGKQKVKSFVGLIHGRLYQQSSTRQPNKVVISDAGVKQEDETWGFVCEAEMKPVDGAGMEVPGAALIPTDLRAGPNVDDYFDTEFGTFHVTAVYPRQTEAEIWGWDTFLEIRR